MPLYLHGFGAHPDDIEITCGGTLLRMIEKGYRVGACDLTRGEMGTRGSAAERKAESEEAARLMGLAVRVNCEIPDSGVTNVREFQSRVVEVLREHRPQVVLLPGPEQRHPDHREAGRLAYDACYFAGLEKLGKGVRHRPRKVLYVHSGYEDRRPTFVVDVTAQMERKVASVLAYRSQFPDPERTAEWLSARARSYGLMIGATYGEGFLQREVMQVEDVVELPGASL